MGIQRKKFFWESYSDEELLSLRFCDLKLSLKNSVVYPLIVQVQKELKAKQILVNPSFWLSSEWFCPDGVLGIAVPFYLAHPRLIELEKSQIGYAEGETRQWCLKILRHEMGHVIDNAFRLRRRKKRSEIFGNSSQAYPSYYDYMRYSKSFVRNLADGYAQSHPAEDFAESFAVWLDHTSSWRNKYKSWPAIHKLEYVDELMKEIAGVRPLITDKEKLEPVEEMDKTLKSHYRRKKSREGLVQDTFWDRGLKRIFSDNIEGLYASTVLKKIRRPLCREVSLNTNTRQYTVNQMLDSVIQRSDELSLKISSDDISMEQLTTFLSNKTKSYLKDGRNLLAM